MHDLESRLDHTVKSAAEWFTLSENLDFAVEARMAARAKRRRAAIAGTSLLVLVVVGLGVALALQSRGEGSSNGIVETVDQPDQSVREPSPPDTASGSEAAAATSAPGVIDDECPELPFIPSYLPEGWSAELRPGWGGLPDQLVCYGHWPGPNIGSHLTVVQGDLPGLPFNVGAEETIDVMGQLATIGEIHEGYKLVLDVDAGVAGDAAVAGPHTLVAYGIDLEEFERVARGLIYADLARVMNEREILLTGAFAEMGVDACCGEPSHGSDTAVTGFVWDGYDVSVYVGPRSSAETGDTTVAGSVPIGNTGAAVVEPSEAGFGLRFACGESSYWVGSQIDAVPEQVVVGAAEALAATLACNPEPAPAPE